MTNVVKHGIGLISMFQKFETDETSKGDHSNFEIWNLSFDEWMDGCMDT